MNKAFVREPDGTEDATCPACGSVGSPVGPETLRAHLSAESLANLAESAYFCPMGTCEVVYFDEFERVITETAFGKPVYPKDPDAPMCGCFGLTAEDVEQDVREGGARRVRELRAKAESSEAKCKLMAASGQCCLPEVLRYFVRLRAAQQER